MHIAVLFLTTITATYTYIRGITSKKLYGLPEPANQSESRIFKSRNQWFHHSMYSGGHISWHELFLAGNQGNHQNFIPSLVSQKL